MLAFILCERIETFLNNEFHWLVSFPFNRLINFIGGSGEEISHFHNYNNRSTAHWNLPYWNQAEITHTFNEDYCHTYNKMLASEAVVHTFYVFLPDISLKTLRKIFVCFRWKETWSYLGDFLWFRCSKVLLLLSKLARRSLVGETKKA